MFNSIIVTLGLIITFSEDATKTCGVPAWGCYKYWNKEVVVQYQTPDYVFYHEMAHAMFWDDFPWNEEIAVSFSEYILDPTFREREPELTWYFNYKLKQYEQTNIQP